MVSPERSVVEIRAHTRREPASWTLSYGEVRLGRDQIAIGFESLANLTSSHRALYEQTVVAAGVDAQDVLVVRISEGDIEVDVLDADDELWPVRTVRVEAGVRLPRPEESDLAAPVIGGLGSRGHRRRFAGR